MALFNSRDSAAVRTITNSLSPEEAKRLDERMRQNFWFILLTLLAAFAILVAGFYLPAPEGRLTQLSRLFAPKNGHHVVYGVFLALITLHAAAYVRGAMALKAEIDKPVLSPDAAELAARVQNALSMLNTIQWIALSAVAYIALEESVLDAKPFIPGVGFCVMLVSGALISVYKTEIWDRVFLKDVVESKEQVPLSIVAQLCNYLEHRVRD